MLTLLQALIPPATANIQLSMITSDLQVFH